MPFGPMELLILLLVLVLFFGARKLPEMGRSLGSGMREFKEAVSGKRDRDEPESLGSGGEVAETTELDEPGTPRKRKTRVAS